MSHYYRNWMIALGIITLIVMSITYVTITNYFALPTQSLVTSIAVAFEGFIFGGAFQFLLEGRRIQHRDRNERIDRYHKKLRELVFVDWLHGSLSGYPYYAAGDLHIKPLLTAQKEPNERYYNDAILHLKAYQLDSERISVINDAEGHNKTLEDYLHSRTGVDPERRNQLNSNMARVWESAQKFAAKLQGVIYDIEDGTLKGTCDYEELVKD